MEIRSVSDLMTWFNKLSDDDKLKYKITQRENELNGNNCYSLCSSGWNYEDASNEGNLHRWNPGIYSAKIIEVGAYFEEFRNVSDEVYLKLEVINDGGHIEEYIIVFKRTTSHIYDKSIDQLKYNFNLFDEDYFDPMFFINKEVNLVLTSNKRFTFDKDIHLLPKL